MRKSLIFTLSMALGAMVALGTAKGQSGDPDADLRSQKPAHERALVTIEQERRVFAQDLARREEECLKRFFSARCMDDIRAEHLREMRGFDLRRETELQALRSIDAELRDRTRKRRVEKNAS